MNRPAPRAVAWSVLASVALLAGCPQRSDPPDRDPNVDMPSSYAPPANVGAPLPPQPVPPTLIPPARRDDVLRPPLPIPNVRAGGPSLPQAYEVARNAFSQQPSQRVAGFTGFDHCAAQAAPRSGAAQDGSAWAEGGQCLPLSLSNLWKAALAQETMIGPGVTKLVSIQRGGDAASANGHQVELVLQSAQKDHGCITPEWTVDWWFRILSGSAEAPQSAEIVFQRKPGETGPYFTSKWYGSYMEKWDGALLLIAKPGDKTSVHMRIDVKAPDHGPKNAVEAISDYLGRLQKKAAGGALPGAVPDPACP